MVRSIKQRELLNAWLRAHNKRRTMPAIDDYQPDQIADELAEMMGFDVEGEGDGARFLITQEGSRLAMTYGNEHIDPDKRTNRYLDDAIAPELYARVVPCYRACLARKRPIYSISTVQDADGKDVSYERLLLPFGSAGRVEQIVGSYKAISIEGGFKLSNLMGIRPKAVPVIIVRAVIDRDLVRVLAGHRASEDIIELS
ncbi:TPM domain-containing protein [Bradyrhizobium erythrophlei]|uniref:TPM domain-containing protein n=1 Tax=Bradyrhizobium erythrophlei TaxID=1437360 RepID=UPI001FD9CEC4|nr:TPM domain-containing protein [Bradyrhizobium erythrophlei]